MADRTVSVTLRAKTDAYNAAMKQAGAASATMASTTTANLSKLGGQMTSMGKSMSVGLTVPMVAAGGAAIKMAGDFNQSFTKMTALAGVSASEIDKLKDSVKDLASETGQGPTELAEALYTLRSSGLDADEAMQALEMSAKASAAGLGETATIADAVSSAMNAYASSGMDAARATDVLVATARAGKAEPEELAGALGRVLPVAAELGVTFEDVGGAVAAFSQTGNDASGSVTLLSNVLMKLLKPSQQGAEMLAKVGLSVQAIRQSIAEDGLLATLQMLSDKLGASNLPMFFEDAQAVNGVMSLLGQNAEGVADTFDQVKNSQGSLGEAFQSWLDGPGSGIQKAWAELQVTLVEVGEELIPVMEDVMGVLADVAGAFNDLPGPVKTAVVALGGLIAIAGPFLIAAGKIAQGIASINAASAAGGAGGAAGWAGRVLGSGAAIGLSGFAAGATLGVVGAENGWFRFLGIEPGDLGKGITVIKGWAGDVIDGVQNVFDGKEITPRLAFGPEMGPPTIPGWTRSGEEFGPPTFVEGRQQLPPGEEMGPPTDLTDAAHALDEARISQDEFTASINETIRVAGKQYEVFARNQEAVAAYHEVISSEEWGQTGITAASTAMSTFNGYLLGGFAQVANTEAAMDGLAAALENVGTVGAGGMKDLNLATEEGRAAFSALSEVAGAFEPQVASAVAAAGGSVETLQGSLAGLNSSFVEMAVAAGIPRAEAEALAVAIGLIPANAQTLIDIQGAEEGKLKLDLMSTAIGLLDEKDQVEIALLIANGQFAEAAALAEAKLAELEAATATAEIDAETMAFEAKAVATGVALAGITNTTALPVIDANPAPFDAVAAGVEAEIAVLTGTTAVPVIDGDPAPFNSANDAVQAALDDLDSTTVTPTISATDNASWVIDHVRSGLASLSSKTVTLTTVHETITRNIVQSAAGRYVPGPTLSTLGEEGPEVVLPLTKPDRMRSLVNDPRVTGPILGALGVRGFAEGGIVGSASGGGVTVIIEAGLAQHEAALAKMRQAQQELTELELQLVNEQKMLAVAVKNGNAELAEIQQDTINRLLATILTAKQAMEVAAKEVATAGGTAAPSTGTPEGVLAAFHAAHPNMYAGGIPGAETPNVIDVTNWAKKAGLSFAGLQGLAGTYSPAAKYATSKPTTVTVQSGAVQVSLVSPQVTQGDVNRTVTSAMNDLGDRIAAGVAT